VLKDVADVLGYHNAKDISRHIDAQYIIKHSVLDDSTTRSHLMICTTRPGLSQVLTTLEPQDTDRQELLQSFRDWVFGDVLESIYDTGGYQVDGSKPQSSHDELMQMALETQQKVVAMLQQNGQQIDHVQKEMTETRREVSEVQKRVDKLDELILGQDVKKQRRIAFETYRGENAPEMRATFDPTGVEAAAEAVANYVQ